MSIDALKIYILSLTQTRSATESVGNKDLEHHHRPALKALLDSVLPGVNAVNEPGKVEFGAPDFVFIKNRFPIGYAETKKLGENLDNIASGEQLKRYFGYANLILTNYLEFRFYKHGEEYCDPIIIADSTLSPDINSFAAFETTIKAFFEDAAEPVRRASRLAEIMGENGKRLRANLLRFLKTDSYKNKPLLDIYSAFKAQLVNDLSLEDFTDMYAQTLVYGLFVARYHDETEKDFSRAEARELIPHTNPLLRRFFDHIAGSDFDDRLKPIVDDLCKVFGNTNVRVLMQQIYKQDLWGVKQSAPDPVIHFYEDFLKAYDPVERKKLGAYYTPPAVVHYIIQSVDEILKRDFCLGGGLADTAKISVMRESQGKKARKDIHKVQILDPATGTGTFLNEAIRHIRSTFTGQEGRFASYVNEDLLPRIHGFELMMAPYTIAHLKLGTTLRESGAKDFSDRIGIYLTNSLEKGVRNEDTLFGLGFSKTISEESNAAAQVKNNTPIMVVVGNPPYSGVSSNETRYANSLIEKYKVEPGGKQKLQERKHWLNDDYVKFIAFAEDMIAKTGYGVMGMITNNGYLDNSTFRGMRWQLAQTFDEIYIIDLHGNSKKKEKALDGSKDENVFDIMQGVGIILGVKTGKKRKGALAKVYHADLYGKRFLKFDLLMKGEIKFIPIELDSKNFYFLPKSTEGQGEYEKGFGLDELFVKNVAGIVTARDGAVVDVDRGALLQRIIKFTDDRYSDDEIRTWLFPKKQDGKYKAGDTRGWKLNEARQKIKDNDHLNYIQKVCYRPFDDRYIYYSPDMVDWGREKTMKNFLKEENLGLVFERSVTSDVFVINSIPEHAFLGTAGFAGQSAPLYVYAEDGMRISNLNSKIVEKIATSTDSKPTPEDIFDYIYAVLYSPKYREKYKEFLKIDFPRVPYPKSAEQFKVLVNFGKELRQLHLLKSSKIREFVTTYPEGGSNKIEKITRKDSKIYINSTQHFAGVSDVVWGFSLGGYKPAQKWLKDRVGQVLASADVEHYQKIIVALAETVRIMAEIDLIS